jgi:hypothetical protein
MMMSNEPASGAAPIYRVTTHVLGGPGGPSIDVYSPVSGGEKHYVARGQCQTGRGTFPFLRPIAATTLREAFDKLPAELEAARRDVLDKLNSQIAVAQANGVPRIMRP